MSADRHDKPPTFAWPPIPDTPVVVTAPDPAAPPRRESIAKRWWRTIESDLLVPTALPLAQRIAQTNWSPDQPDEYCQRCAHSIGPFEPDEFGCANCRNKKLPWSFAARVGAYESHLADWIREVKFHANRWLAVSLAKQLAAALQRAGLPDSHAAIVPVPTSRRRRISRGIDHTNTLARGVARELNNASLVRALSRIHRPSQLSVPVSGRQANVTGAIRPIPHRIPRLEGRTVVLIDDVTTTGATLRAAARALRDAGIPRQNIWVAVLSVAPKPDRLTGEDRGGTNQPPRGPGVDKAPKPVLSTSRGAILGSNSTPT